MAWYCGNNAAPYEGCSPTFGCSPWFAEARCGGVHAVAQKRPNAFGLFDTSGNVAEFTGSLLRTYTTDTQIDPGFDAVILYVEPNPGGPWDMLPTNRGGWWSERCDGICSAFRMPQNPHYAGSFMGAVGFRLVRTLPSPDAPLLVRPGSGPPGPR